MIRSVHFHFGLDRGGNRYTKRRDTAEMRRALERRRLHPVVLVVNNGATQPRWRNGLQRRRWLVLTEQVRGDRRCFLMTLRHKPLVPPIAPF